MTHLIMDLRIAGASPEVDKGDSAAVSEKSCR